MSQLTDYYMGVGADCEGRTLDETWSWSYKKIEFSHDHIQWWFPLKEPSNFNPDAPLLTDEDIALFRANPVMQENLLRSFRVFLDFLGLEVTSESLQMDGEYVAEEVIVQKAKHFEDECRVLFKRANHNWLRITRVITCLKTIGTHPLTKAADAFFECLRKLHEEEGLVSENSFSYWKQAWSITTN